MAEEIKPKYVIFDTDMGGDDAWALQMLLKAEKLLKTVKVLAITTINGNTTTDNAIKNTYRILDGVGRTDIPIYKGATEPIISYDRGLGKFWGTNGFSDVEFWKPHYPNDINDLIQRKSAIEIIRELVMDHPNEVTLIALGPLTNIALAIKAYPEIKELIRDVFIMGGNFKGRGNSLKAAEFNFYSDPEAAYIVLNSLKCPITVLPFECGLEESINIPVDWRFNELGKFECENVKLLNEVERIACGNRTLYKPFDALLVAVFLFPEECINIKRTYNATIELHGSHTRGQMVFNRKTEIHNHNVSVIETLHEDKIKERLLWTVNP